MSLPIAYSFWNVPVVLSFQLGTFPIARIPWKKTFPRSPRREASAWVQRLRRWEMKNLQVPKENVVWMPFNWGMSPHVGDTGNPQEGKRAREYWPMCLEHVFHHPLFSPDAVLFDDLKVRGGGEDRIGARIELEERLTKVLTRVSVKGEPRRVIPFGIFGSNPVGPISCPSFYDDDPDVLEKTVTEWTTGTEQVWPWVPLPGTAIRKPERVHHFGQAWWDRFMELVYEHRIQRVLLWAPRRPTQNQWLRFATHWASLYTKLSGV